MSKLYNFGLCFTGLISFGCHAQISVPEGGYRKDGGGLVTGYVVIGQGGKAVN